MLKTAFKKKSQGDLYSHREFKSNFPFFYMGVSENSGTPKSSMLIGFSIKSHPFWGTSIFGNTHIDPSGILDILGAPHGVMPSKNGSPNRGHDLIRETSGKFFAGERCREPNDTSLIHVKCNQHQSHLNIYNFCLHPLHNHSSITKLGWSVSIVKRSRFR